MRKVTAFITRGHGLEAELLVFSHAVSGVQVPAGTVEPGESFEAAVLREATEETGLAGPFRLRRLGQITSEIGPERAVLGEGLALRFAPSKESDLLTWPLGRAWTVRVVEHVNGFARVIYEVRDLEDASPDAMVYVHIEGWAPEDSLVYRLAREFFHLELQGPSEDRWELEAEGRHIFRCYWEPLMPRPASLLPQQDEWLREFYDDLVVSVSRS